MCLIIRCKILGGITKIKLFTSVKIKETVFEHLNKCSPPLCERLNYENVIFIAIS